MDLGIEIYIVSNTMQIDEYPLVSTSACRGLSSRSLNLTSRTKLGMVSEQTCRQTYRTIVCAYLDLFNGTELNAKRGCVTLENQNVLLSTGDSVRKVVVQRIDKAVLQLGL